MEDLIYVCARATSPLTVKGSTFTRQCRDCGARVMVAPSGERLLQTTPTAVIICMVCAPKYVAQADALGVTKEAITERGNIEPNTWKDRN